MNVLARLLYTGIKECNTSPIASCFVFCLSGICEKEILLSLFSLFFIFVLFLERSIYTAGFIQMNIWATHFRFRCWIIIISLYNLSYIYICYCVITQTKQSKDRIQLQQTSVSHAKKYWPEYTCSLKGTGDQEIAYVFEILRMLVKLLKTIAQF